ncbi:MAG TPA: NAD(P)-dependent alcohol dehydrogenase [Nitrososphaeraceae archaeon]|jgi:propanol-preferring alcohol dehydrogenase|nr:NAD(P)-dependent alcohol dehydrogenase [Nitrososphaeraceae archaeon]
MLSARIHKYQEPLPIDNTSKPRVHGEGVLVRVGAAGLCHSDLHLINGEWKDVLPLKLPKTPGHEIAGWIEEIGESVPESAQMKEGDLVAVFGGWGCGICIYCKRGDEQLCDFPRWPGLSDYDGGYSEYIMVPTYRFLIKVDKQRSDSSNIGPEELAPLTDAGLTPYRAIKKIRHLLGPGKTIAIFGIGGLGSYAIQYAKILGQSSTVIALDRREEKLQLAEKFGADYIVNISKSQNIRSEIISKISEGKGPGVDVVIDCVGADATIEDSCRILNKGGSLVVVGLFGSQIKMPLVRAVLQEYQAYGSLWGNYIELREVIELAKTGKIKHSIQKFPLNEINEAIQHLKNGKIVGRGVVIP